jgi:hypothetical protein
MGYGKDPAAELLGNLDEAARYATEALKASARALAAKHDLDEKGIADRLNSGFPPMTPAEAVTGKTMREDLVQATVQPAVSEGAVSDALVQLTFRVEPRAVHIVRGACTDIANIYHMRILEHVSNFDESQTAPLSQRQNETDSLRLERDALLAALTEILKEADGTNYLNSPQTSLRLIIEMVDAALAKARAGDTK